MNCVEYRPAPASRAMVGLAAWRIFQSRSASAAFRVASMERPPDPAPRASASSCGGDLAG